MSNWLGGNNFSKQKKWAMGRQNDGAGRRRQGLTKRGRFNPNFGYDAGMASSPRIMRSTSDKKKFEENGMPQKFYKSGLI